MNNATKYIYNLLNNKEIAWIEDNLNIKLTSQQKQYINHISAHADSIILKKRQLGVSTAIICWNIYNCFNETKVNSLIVCTSPQMSFNICKSILTNANIKTDNYDTNHKIKFENDNIIYFKTPQCSRGCGPTHLSIDDVNNVKDLYPIWGFSRKNVINLTEENKNYYEMYLNAIDATNRFKPLNLNN